VKVRFRPEAAVELREARAWYAAREKDLGQQFVAAVDAAVKRIAMRPHAFPALPRPTTVRRAQLRRFPFVVLFRILGHEMIEVLAVAHARRRPGYWRSRVR
jgi:plasmid stabilization system protein ParE